jgi:hypothetical protein
VAGIFLDLENNAVLGAGDAIRAVTETTTGASVDFVDVVGNMGTALLKVATVSGSGSPSPSLAAKIQESTDGTTWTDITGATFTTVTTTTNNQACSFRTLKRYVRGYYTVAGQTSPSFTSCLTFLGQRRTTPSGNGGWTNESGASV